MDTNKTPTLTLWDLLKTPDQRFTKPYPKSGMKLTSTDATWIVREMTRHFGPPRYIEPTKQDGIPGWGYEEVTFINGPEMFLSQVRVWVFINGVRYTTTHWGGAETIFRSKGNVFVDTDCAKKALTDALTKSLSYLGMCADNWLAEKERTVVAPVLQMPRQPVPDIDDETLSPDEGPLMEMAEEIGQIVSKPLPEEAPATNFRRVSSWDKRLNDGRIKKVETLDEIAAELKEEMEDEPMNPIEREHLLDTYRKRKKELGL